MDIINELSDDLLLRILSLVHTKTVFDAQLVSKRWRYLWRILPSLYYDYASHKTESQFLLFMQKTMDLLESTVLDKLYIRLAPKETSFDPILSYDLLAKRAVRELEFISTDDTVRTQLRKGIYQFQTLVILRLERFSLEHDFGSPISLKSLKVLKLCRVNYLSDKSLSNLLSNLPSLEELSLDQCFSAQPAKNLVVSVPSLRRLTVLRCPDSCQNHVMTLNVNTPCLKYLNVEEYWRKVSFSDVKMEELVEADVNVTYIDTMMLLRSLVSVKRLSLCLVTSKIPRVDIFDKLVRLEICTCQHEWWNLLERVLLDAPRLRMLKLHQKHCFGLIDPKVRWQEPSFVPECFASHLEIFEWRDYEGTEDEKELVRYILRNALKLKIATIYPLVSHPDKRKHMIRKNIMRKELENLSLCKLVFK